MLRAGAKGLERGCGHIRPVWRIEKQYVRRSRTLGGLGRAHSVSAQQGYMRRDVQSLHILFDHPAGSRVLLNERDMSCAT